METKFCGKCKQNLPHSAFGKRSKPNQKYLRGNCKECEASYAAELRAKQVQEGLRPSPKYARCKDEEERKWRRKNSKMKDRYGIGLEEFDAMLFQQKHSCANIGCNNKHNDPLPLHVDHCHETNRVRGLLCRECNLALGHIQEDLNKMIGLVEYLKLQGDK